MAAPATGAARLLYDGQGCDGIIPFHVQGHEVHIGAGMIRVAPSKLLKHLNGLLNPSCFQQGQAMSATAHMEPLEDRLMAPGCDRPNGATLGSG